MAKKKLVLLGGGHTHALFIKLWRAHPLPDVDVVLVSPRKGSTYSGMLHGYLTGLYSFEEIHIDLVQLCRSAGITLVEDKVVHIDVIQRKVKLNHQPDLSWDMLSINIGSATDKEGPGFAIKPMDDFLPNIPLMDQASRLAIVGGGVGGVELALSLQSRYRGTKAISLIQRDAELMPQAPAAVRQRLTRLCQERGIQLHLNQSPASAITEAYDFVLWATTAKGPSLLRDSGLAVNERGFLLTDETFQCQGQDGIFAVGDCAIIPTQPRPRAGVYAVRSARPLYENILRYGRGQVLQKVRLQKKHLILIPTGKERAMALRGSLYWEASWVWNLKDWIDRSFMNQFKSP